MHVHICTCIQSCTDVLTCTLSSTHLHTHTVHAHKRNTHVHVHICKAWTMCSCTLMHEHKCTLMGLHAYNTYIYTYACVYMNTQAQVHTCTYKHLHSCIHSCPQSHMLTFSKCTCVPAHTHILSHMFTSSGVLTQELKYMLSTSINPLSSLSSCWAPQRLKDPAGADLLLRTDSTGVGEHEVILWGEIPQSRGQPQPGPSHHKPFFFFYSFLGGHTR